MDPEQILMGVAHQHGTRRVGAHKALTLLNSMGRAHKKEGRPSRKDGR